MSQPRPTPAPVPIRIGVARGCLRYFCVLDVSPVASAAAAACTCYALGRLTSLIDSVLHVGTHTPHPKQRLWSTGANSSTSIALTGQRSAKEQLIAKVMAVEYRTAIVAAIAYTVAYVEGGDKTILIAFSQEGDHLFVGKFSCHAVLH